MKEIKVNAASWWDAKLYAIGAESMPLLVIDNFYPAPDMLLQDAALKAFSANAPYYPGIRAKTPPAYFNPIIKGLSEVFQSVFNYSSDKVSLQECFYSLVTTPGNQLNMMQRLPHVDGGDDRKLALLHYLCGEDCGGTAFYRQVKTGFETVPNAKFQTYSAAVKAEHERLGPPSQAYFNESDARFEKIDEVQAKPNRAVIYFGINLHAVLIGDKALSENPYIGRLTVNSFFTPQ